MHHGKNKGEAETHKRDLKYINTWHGKWFPLVTCKRACIVIFLEWFTQSKWYFIEYYFLKDECTFLTLLVMHSEAAGICSLRS